MTKPFSNNLLASLKASSIDNGREPPDVNV